MKLKQLGLGMLLVAGLASSAHAALLAYEGFEYPITGEVVGLNGGTGWTGPWQENVFVASQSNGNFPLAADSLNSSAFPFTPAGGRVRAEGVATGSFNFDSITRAMPSLNMNSDTTRYFSFLFRKDVAAATANNLEFNLVTTASTGVNDFRFGATSGDEFFLTSTAANDLGGDVSIGETYFVVMKVDANSGVTPDVLSLALYSSTDTVPLTEPAEWYLTYTVNSAVNLDTIRLRTGNNTAGSFDEFRIGDTWADVATVPEPYSAVIAIMSGILGGVFLRRARNVRNAA